MVIALNSIHGNKSNQVPRESRWLSTQKYGDYDPSVLFYINDCSTGFCYTFSLYLLLAVAALNALMEQGYNSNSHKNEL